MFAVALLISFVCTVGAAVLAMLVQRLTGLPVVVVVIVGSALWAAWDSSKLEFSRYKGGNSPLVLLLGIMALWLLGLPWYLAKRYQVKRGAIPLVE
jgi:hypothetical protein